MFKSLLVLILTGILFFNSAAVHACHCGALDPPLVEAEWADAVFTGIVLTVTPADDPNYIVALVWVTAFWKGAGLGTVQVYTDSSPAACGFTFQLSDEYLFYAKNGITCCGLGVALCTRTSYVSSAQEDLEALGPPVGSIPVTFQSWGAIKKHYE
jgi:hypothetical protein